MLAVVVGLLFVLSCTSSSVALADDPPPADAPQDPPPPATEDAPPADAPKEDDAQPPQEAPQADPPAAAGAEGETGSTEQPAPGSDAAPQEEPVKEEEEKKEEQTEEQPPAAEEQPPAPPAEDTPPAPEEANPEPATPEEPAADKVEDPVKADDAAVPPPPPPPPAPIETPEDPFQYGPYDDDEFANVNIPAFQPSHLLSFIVPPGQSELFFYDMLEADKGSVARGNFFVTAGGDMRIKAMVSAPDGSEVWSKSGDFGSISFKVADNGTYTITLSNPDFQESRRVTFAWLVGPDTDRPTAAVSSDAPLSPMYKSVNRIHTRLDKVISLMTYIDIHLSRNEETSKLTKSRVALLTLAETSALVIATLLQIWYLRRLLNNSSLGCLPGGARPLR